MPEPETLADTSASDRSTAWRDRVELLTAGSAGSPFTPGRLAAMVVAAVAAVVAVVLVVRQPAGPATELELPLASDVAAPSSSTTAPLTDVVVHAAGSVRQPGLYRLAIGSRVADLLDAAGGAADDADLDRLNLAAPVADGEQVYVPAVGEVVPAGDDVPTEDLASTVVDLNTATAEQLEALSGVGPVTAAAILEERERRGRFGSVDELLEVPGIGEVRLEQLRPFVRV